MNEEINKLIILSSLSINLYDLHFLMLKIFEKRLNSL